MSGSVDLNSMLHSVHVGLYLTTYLPEGSLIGLVLGAAVLFLATLVFYRFWVRRLNNKLAGTPEQQASVKRVHGITDEQIALGWRYIGF